MAWSQLMPVWPGTIAIRADLRPVPGPDGCNERGAPPSSGSGGSGGRFKSKRTRERQKLAEMIDVIKRRSLACSTRKAQGRIDTFALHREVERNEAVLGGTQVAAEVERLEQSIDRARGFVAKLDNRKSGIAKALLEGNAASAARLVDAFAAGSTTIAPVGDNNTAAAKASLARGCWRSDFTSMRMAQCKDWKAQDQHCL
jgi:hypothetical protein